MRKFLIVMVAACVIFGLLAVAIDTRRKFPPPSATPGITLENFKGIHQGMKGEEVEAIFGCPGKLDDRYYGYRIWIGSDCKIRINWTSDGMRVRSGELVTNDGEVFTIP